MTDAMIVAADARLVRVPVDPPRGDAIQKFDALEVPIVDVTDRPHMLRLVSEFKPAILFHAAALKHVPLLEENWEAAIETNVFGTLACAVKFTLCGRMSCSTVTLTPAESVTVRKSW